MPQMIMGAVPLLGIVFSAGTQVNRIDDLFNKAYSQEVEQKKTDLVIGEIHQKVTRIETILDERLKPT
jgi:hypothetical protein